MKLTPEQREQLQTYRHRARYATWQVLRGDSLLDVDDCLKFIHTVGTPEEIKERADRVLAVLKEVERANLADEPAEELAVRYRSKEEQVYDALAVLGHRLDDLYDYAAGWVVPSLASHGLRFDPATRKLAKHVGKRGRPAEYVKDKIRELYRAWHLSGDGTGNTQEMRDRIRSALVWDYPPELLTDDEINRAIKALSPRIRKTPP